MGRERSRHQDALAANPAARTTLDAVRRALRRQLAAGERVDCYLCHQPIRRDAKAPDRGALQVDHVRPYSDQDPSTWDVSNLSACHAGCNRAKGRSQWVDPRRGPRPQPVTQVAPRPSRW